MLLFLHIFIVFCMFVIGTLFGSFFSLATYRIPRHQDIVATRSYCTSCKHRLEFFDLIPVLSYIVRGGKCKYCGEKISIRYFLLEVINGLIFVAFYLIFGYNLNLFFVCLVYAVLFVLIGASIMKSKMTEEEKKEISLKMKKGVFISELVVAMILFTVFMASAFILTRNYNKNINEKIARSNAISLAVKNIEMAISTDYDELYSFTDVSNVDDIEYKVNVNVEKYSDKDFSKKDIVKIINVNVDYMFNGKSYDFELKTLKGKVL